MAQDKKRTDQAVHHMARGLVVEPGSTAQKVKRQDRSDGLHSWGKHGFIGCIDPYRGQLALLMLMLDDGKFLDHGNPAEGG